jgi:hypothetical protein
VSERQGTKWAQSGATGAQVWGPLEKRRGRGRERALGIGRGYSHCFPRQLFFFTFAVGDCTEGDGSWWGTILMPGQRVGRNGGNGDRGKDGVMESLGRPRRWAPQHGWGQRRWEAYDSFNQPRKCGPLQGPGGDGQCGWHVQKLGMGLSQRWAPVGPTRG